MKTKKFEKTLGIMLIIISYTLLYAGTTIFYKGFHNVDLAHNFQKIAIEENELLTPYNITFNKLHETYDKTSNGEIITLQQGYHKGINYMIESQIYIILSTITITLGIINVTKK